MARLQWWLHKNAPTVSYLAILAIIVGLLVLAGIKGGHW